MSPSEIRSAVSRVDGIACESPHEGRDLNGARSMRALPWVMTGGMACRRPKSDPRFGVWMELRLNPRTKGVT